MKWWNSKPMKEVRDTYADAAELKRKIDSLGGVKEERTDAPLPPEQALPQAPISQVPQIARVQTADLGLSKGKAKDGEQPLGLAEMRELQRSGILDLVGQLRTQRRLFG
jgi:hypothetical protein